jgi:hypothetical protein
MRWGTLRTLLSAAFVTSGLLLSACGLPSSSTGTIKGQLLAYGGISVSLKGRPLEGQVRATSTRGRSFETSVPKDGDFVLQVPTGTYSLVGSSPQFGGGQYGCFARVRVTVSEGQTTKEDVVCPEK